MTVEILTAALVLVLGLITTGAAFVGILGSVDAIRFVRCENCDRLNMVRVRAALPVMECRHCSHAHALHWPDALRWHHVTAPRH